MSTATIFDFIHADLGFVLSPLLWWLLISPLTESLAGFIVSTLTIFDFIHADLGFVLSPLLWWLLISPLTESLAGFIVSTLTIFDGSGQKKGAAKGAAPNKFHHWEVEEVRIKLEA